MGCLGQRMVRSRARALPIVVSELPPILRPQCFLLARQRARKALENQHSRGHRGARITIVAEARVRLLVRGRVQGVGFRYAAREAASECGVAGWVRNLADGSVEIVAQGATTAVERMTGWASRGPRHAAVTGVDVDREAPDPALSGFEIRR